MGQPTLYELSQITVGPHSFKSNKPKAARRFKPARQLLTDETKYLQSKNLKFDTPTYTSLVSPPTLKPIKKYCDITGLEGKYKCPSNGIRFHDVEVYQEVVKNMTTSLDQEYLSLRGANVVLK
ncbi:chromatin-remodeling complex subunit Ies6p [[Candida] jaroonii]|uniref:Chromatin-remodeling complex subunit Ies6p n=1 Tax=[Candida] jaroonii TaxID=467808 RepID=A0ACA9Y0S6_9ASCO|nr:chromatin-remodeling complex subunit Ies6p [[Candida] jaroonii]